MNPHFPNQLTHKLGGAEVMAFINLNDTGLHAPGLFCKSYIRLTVRFSSAFPGVCSVFGNSTLLYVSYKKKHLLKPAEYFIVNLAVSDLGLTVSLYPMAIASSFCHRYTSKVSISIYQSQDTEI